MNLATISIIHLSTFTWKRATKEKKNELTFENEKIEIKYSYKLLTAPASLLPQSSSTKFGKRKGKK